MSYTKSYKPEVANIVGIQAALLLNHIKYWMDSKGKEKIYRTNTELSSDFEGSLSESQVQRAKKRLVDFGFIIVTHDKGHTRTTHFTLTEKAKTLLNVVVKKVKDVKETVSKKVNQVKEKITGSKSSMDKSFDEGFQNKNAIPYKPDPELLKKIRSAGGIQEKENTAEEKVMPTSFSDPEDWEQDDEDYFSAIDKGFQECSVKEESISMSELMKRAFNQVPNLEDFNKKLQMQMQAQTFKEDF